MYQTISGSKHLAQRLRRGFTASGLVCLLLSALVCAPVLAQSAFKPTGSVKIVVMFPPGGGTDAVARIMVERLTEL